MLRVPELLLELLTEEIPARLQARAERDLCRLAQERLDAIALASPVGFVGPRRLGFVMQVRGVAEVPGVEERGPRIAAPEAALEGFLKKHGSTRADVAQQDGYWVLRKPPSSREATRMIQEVLPRLLWEFPWPKSMRWGLSQFMWVRPLQRILCLLDGSVVPFALERDGDAAHGLRSGNLSQGHRVHAPAAFEVQDYAHLQAELQRRFVVLQAQERESLIRAKVDALADQRGLEVVADPGLVAEVSGLVEWPMAMIGTIDQRFMALPEEVLQTSMRVNQRYFSLRSRGGKAAPHFAVVANIEASDGGRAVLDGNERVLRARLSDAEFFWKSDLEVGLDSFVTRLSGVTFHKRLGSQAQRVARIEQLAGWLAAECGLDVDLVRRTARLCKADLASGMVGEFPELQGVMGSHYARAAGEAPEVVSGIAQHYRPIGPSDSVPETSTGVAVALADKLDTLAGFFAIDEAPSGSSDPYALRRAALGVIRIIVEHKLRLNLRTGISRALQWLTDDMGGADPPIDVSQERVVSQLFAFILERLRAQLKSEGRRLDIVTAAVGSDDDLSRILARGAALQTFVDSPDGQGLLTAYRRASNILRAEAKKGFDPGPVDADALVEDAEATLFRAATAAEATTAEQLADEQFPAAMTTLSALGPPLDAFFENVFVADPTHRTNRLRLLSYLVSVTHQVADLSKIEA